MASERQHVTKQLYKKYPVCSQETVVKKPRFKQRYLPKILTWKKGQSKWSNERKTKSKYRQPCNTFYIVKHDQRLQLTQVWYQNRCAYFNSWYSNETFLFYFYFVLILKLRHNVFWILRLHCTFCRYILSFWKFYYKTSKTKKIVTNQNRNPIFNIIFRVVWDFVRFGQGCGI